MRPSPLPLCLAAALAAGISGRLAGAPALPEGPLPVGIRQPVDFAGLHNVVRLSEKLYSGGVPEGDPGFAALRRLGIRTVITVDGAPPDLERARKAGLRYVHLPIGYDGCPTPKANLIVKAVRDLPGPIYLHCHHGKNRSPAAAAFARIALDRLAPDRAVAEMEIAGTGRNYVGLYADVRAYRPPTAADLDALPAAFPEHVPTPPLVTAMVGMEKRLDTLLKLQTAGWPAASRDTAAHEALQLWELYAETNRTAENRRRPADYRGWMSDGERFGRALEQDLRAGRLDQASLQLGRIAAGCGSCHAKYRNVPQR